MLSLADFMRGNLQAMPPTSNDDGPLEGSSKPIPSDSVFVQVPKDEPTLIKATRYNDVQMINRSSRQGENVNCTFDGEYVVQSNRLFRSIRLIKYSPLHVACIHSELQTIECLLENNADVNISDDNMRTPLHCASTSNRADVVDLLLARGANVNVQMKSGRTPLMEAVQAGSLPIVRSLIQQCADVNLRDTKGTSALFMAVSSTVNRNRQLGVDICSQLIEGGGNVDEENAMHATPMMMATGLRNIPLLKFFISRGADVNHMDNKRRTAFHFCMEQNNMEETGWFLVHRGADVNSPDIRGKTPLDKAVEFGKIGTIHFLLRADCVREPDLIDTEKIQKLCDLFPPFRVFLRKEFLQPWSLMRLCRYTIRNKMYKNNLSALGDLSLPHSLKDYLMHI